LSDLFQLLNDNEKGTTLPALLARFVEAYECSPNRAEYVLKFRHLLGRNSEAVKQVNSKTSGALAFSDAASQQGIFEKTLHTSSKFLDVYENLLRAWYLGNSWDFQDELTEDEVTSWDQDFQLSDEERASRGDLLDGTYLHSKLEEEAESFESNPGLKRAIASELGLSPDVEGFDLALRRYQANKNESEKRHFAILESPRAMTFWAKELVGRLGEIVGREEGLDSHPFAAVGEHIPIAHRTLFEQAHMLYLFDFDIPCVLTCGTLVEELVEKEFPALNQKWAQQQRSERKSVSWRSKVRDVISENPLFREAEEFLLGIMFARNEVAHDPAAYLRAGRQRSEEILRKTRKVLEIFYETLQTQNEGN
jgi:hypothetical protein